MTLAAGTSFGAFEITGTLGAGGMGEVYRARDTKLKRDVAIKVLPETVAQDPDRVARFQREAEVLATLNHPNIAAVYGFEETPGASGIVLELVDGPTLAHRIALGPVPLDEAIAIAKQVGDALDAAHQRGVIHRDLKPANIKVREDGTVKVLDFGLAKIMDDVERIPSSGPAGFTGLDSRYPPSLSPTIMSPAVTGAGVLLGTAAYMSPEQARGKCVDKRADIWAFGVVFYEMVAGRALFAGDTITDTLAAVVTTEPDWDRVPRKLRTLIERCLQKDQTRRLRDIGDAWRLLDEVPTAAVTRSHRSNVAMAVAAVTTMAFAALAWTHFRELTPRPQKVVRLQGALPIGAQPDLGFALSPDGRRLAFAASDGEGVRRIWIRALDDVGSRPVPGTEGLDTAPMFWSADNRSLAFSAGNVLKRIDPSGGPAQRIADVTGLNAIGGAWSLDGVIVFGSNPAGRPGGGSMFRVSATGGTPMRLTNVDESRSEVGHRHPTFLPDGRHFLYLKTSTRPENTGIYVGSIDATPEQQSSTPLLAIAHGPAFYVPIARGGTPAVIGQLLFLRDNTLMAQPFDPSRLTLAGEAVAVADGVGAWLDRGLFSGADDGTLAYASGSGALNYQLTWFDDQAEERQRVGEPGPYTTVVLSPNAERAAVVRSEYTAGFKTDIWLWDLSRGAETRFTFEPGRNGNPVWSPDGAHIVFGSRDVGRSVLYHKAASGAQEATILLTSDAGETLAPTSWSRDGRFVLFTRSNAKSGTDIWILPMDGRSKAAPLLQTEFGERDARFSPDGRWIAYTSSESGRDEVYIRGFSLEEQPTTSGKWLISRDGGLSPRWLANGGRLSYREPRLRGAPGVTLMVVDVLSGPAFQLSPPRPLPAAPLNVFDMFGDVTADGSRWLAAVPTAGTASPLPFNVVLNWPAGLEP